MNYSATHLPSTLELASELIRLPSITPEDAGCQNFIRNYLTPLGFACWDLSQNGTSNLWARLGTKRPLLAFAGHTDVVPTGPRDQWKHDPFDPQVDEGILYGRGVVDMKGALAAMLRAATLFIEKNPHFSGSLAFLITSDEEGSATYGTPVALQALKQKGELPDACLIGEPTSDREVGDTLKFGRRGSLNGQLIVQGKQGHVAYPEDAVNPIHALPPYLNALLTHPWDTGDPAFPPASFQVANLRSGTGASNVIPPDLTLQFNLRFPFPFQADHFQRKIEQICHTVQKQLPHVSHTLSWLSAGQPFVTHSPLLLEKVDRAIQKITGKNPIHATNGGSSDGKFIAPLGVPVVELGLCHETAHQINEHAPVQDLDTLTSLYESFLNEFFN